MHQFVKIFLLISFLAINALGFDYHQNYTFHLLQGILECGGLILFAYYIINLDSTISNVRLLILLFAGAIFKYVSLVIAKIMHAYYPVFSESYGNYLFIGILFLYAVIIYFGIERKNKLGIA